MNKKGFTLVELLATIVLLAIIVAIAIPTVNTVINKNKIENCKTLRDSVINAGILYVSDNKYDLEWENDTTIVKYSDLYSLNDTIAHNDKYLKSAIINPCNNDPYKDDFSLEFKNNNGKIELASDFVFPDEFTCCK